MLHSVWMVDGQGRDRIVPGYEDVDVEVAKAEADRLCSIHGAGAAWAHANVGERPSRAPLGRPPLWPLPWMTLAEKCGGYSTLRAHLGLKSKTSLSGRITGTIPWTRDDVLSLAGLCRVYDLKLADLIEPLVVCSVLVLGLGSYPAPGVRK